jgi:transcriptional regulator with XRE-family HTH domain
MPERPIKLSNSKILGARLLASRQLAGFSQKEAAAKLGVSATALGNYEMGKAEPSLAALIRIARIYDDNETMLLRDLEPEADESLGIDYEAARVGYRLQRLRGGRARAWLAKQAKLEPKQLRMFELGALIIPEITLHDIAYGLDVKPIEITGKTKLSEPIVQGYVSPHSDGGAAQFPPLLIGGIEQDEICISTEQLMSLDVVKPRSFSAPKQTSLHPYWGVFPGDGLIVDGTVKSYDIESVYVVELKGEISLRAIMKRGRTLWFEPQLGSSESEPVPADCKIAARVVWRAGSLLESRGR